MTSAPVIDVHTHMLTEHWLELLEQHGNPRYAVKEVLGGLRAIHLDGAPCAPLRGICGGAICASLESGIK